MKKLSIFNYFVVLLIILCSGSVFFYLKYSTITIPILLISGLVITYINRNINKYNIILAGASILTILANDFIISDTLNIKSDIGTSLIILSTALICSNMCFKDYKKLFINIMCFICIISLIFYTISILNPNFPQSVGKFEVIKNIKYFYNPFYTFGWENFHKRNAGIFWEPGCYQAFINLAILFLDKNHKNWIIKISIFIITLSTTLSTTGYIVFFIIAIYKFLLYKKDIKNNLYNIGIVSCIIIVGIFIFKSPVIQNKIFGKSASFLIRKNDTLMTMKVLSEKPILGYGWHSTLLTEKLNNLNVQYNSNSLLMFAASFGIPVLCIYFYFMYKSLNNLYPYRTSILIVVFFIFFSTEALMLLPAFLCFIFKFKDNEIALEDSTIKKKISLICQFSPPIHGLSKAVDSLYNSNLKNKYDFIKINTTNNKLFILNLFKILFTDMDLAYITIALSKWGNLRDLIVIKILLLKNKKIVVHLHGNNYRELIDKDCSTWQRKINYKLFKELSMIIVLTKTLKENFKGMILKDKIRVISNCIDDEFSCSEQEYRTKLENIKHKETLTVLYLSNFIEDKGYKNILQVAKRLKNLNIENFNFVFAGKFYGENDKTYFFDFIKDNELGHMVKYEGIVNGEIKKNLLYNSDIFMLPTRYRKEGQPISILEAMGNGLVIVTTNQGGIKDMVKNNINGFIVNHNGHEEMVNKLIYLLNNKNSISEICENNYNCVKKVYTEELYINKLDEVFMKVLSDES